MMQTEGHKEHEWEELFQICRHKVAEKFDHGPFETWRNEQFVLLSKALHQKTDLLISTDTLKRFFGKKETTVPQLATREALAKYLDYPDWAALVRDLKTSVKEPLTTPIAKRTDNLSKTKKGIIYSGLGILLFTLGLLCWCFWPENIKFSVSGSTEGNIPHFVSFRFSDKNIWKSDSFYLDLGYSDWLFPQFSNVKLHKSTTMYNESYQYPGWYATKLSVGNTILDTIYVHAKHSDWVGLAGFPFQPPDIFPLIKRSNYISHDSLLLAESGFNPFKHYISELRYFNVFSIAGDALEASMVVENNITTGGKSCFDVYLDIECERGKISLQFVEPGCEKYAHFRVSEIWYDGRYEDLSAFGALFDVPRRVTCRVEKGILTAFLDDKELFIRAYNQPIGVVKGVRVISKGICKLYSFKMQDLGNGQIIQLL